MNFIDLGIKNEYRTLEENIVKDFLVPTMSVSVLYQRAVGFFSSSALACYAYGISELIKNNGRVELVASPKLSDEDIKAIDEGYRLRSDVVESALIRELKEPKDIFEKKRLNLLAYYIAINKLELKIAYIDNGNGISIYHEKLGIFHDADGNIICFTGSMNESLNAFSQNYESVDVFKSWLDEERVIEKTSAFARIWGETEPNLTIEKYTDVNKEFLKKYSCPEDELDFDVDKKQFNFQFDLEQLKRKQTDVISFPEENLRDYQKNAIDKWEVNNFRGIFDMCTGSGKTFTALGAIKRCYEKNNKWLAVVIVVPYQHLVEQWVEDLNKYNYAPIIGYGTSKYNGYEEKLKKAVFRYNLKAKKLLCFITTNDSFIKPEVQEILAGIKGKCLLVVDEAHNFGASTRSEKLSDKFDFRLALSATFDRHSDPDGTAKLYDYFGQKCAEYSLKQAIEEHKLTPYEYYPVVVYLTDKELDRYNQLSEELNKSLSFDKDGKPYLSLRAQKIAIKRSRIVAGAVEKLELLKEKIIPFARDNNILVYCGATTLLSEDVEDYEVDQDIRQIDLVTQILGNDLGMKVAQYTSKEKIAEREEIKEQFANGVTLQALVAIKCLDEGVNIPGIKTAFILASTTNPKEYIQRRGRVLRLAPGKDRAMIFDFVTLPRHLYQVGNLEEEFYRNDYTLVRNELQRVKEFKSLALNPFESDELINDVTEAYGLVESEDGFVKLSEDNYGTNN